MKIAMLGTKGIPATWGGVERHVEEIATRLVAMGHDVTVYCRPYYTTTKDEYYKGVHLKKIPTIPSKDLDTVVHTFFSTLHLMLEDYDVVHYHAIGPATLSLLPRLGGKKVVVTVHGLDWQREKWESKKAQLFLKFGEYAAVKFPDATITVSRYLKDYLEKKYGKAVNYIPSAVTDPVLRKPNLIRQYGLEGNDYILFVARLVPEKGCHFLIDAYKRLNTKYKLVIAGGSSHSDEYVEELHRQGEGVAVFTGYIYGELLQELYTNAYCYVHPSTIEGLPVTLLEAMAYGNCIISSDVPANLEVVRDAGIIFKSRDVDDLQEALQTAIDSPILVRELKDRARALGVAEYNYDRITEKTEALYRSLVCPEDASAAGATSEAEHTSTPKDVEHLEDSISCRQMSLRGLRSRKR